MKQPLSIIPDETLQYLLDLIIRTRAALKSNFDQFQFETFGTFEPNSDLLRKVVDAVFWASLSEEEGKASLARIQLKDTRKPSCRISPLDISPASLRKLSPFMDGSSTFLHINPQAQISGIGSGAISETGIIALRSGHLAVTYGAYVFGVFEEGVWSLINKNHLYAMASLEKVFPQKTLAQRGFGLFSVIRLLLEVRRFGRGATLVLLPPNQLKGIGSISFKVEEFSAWKEAYETDQSISQSAPKNDQERLIQTLQKKGGAELSEIFVAIAGAGAGIDGATLIDPANLNVYGFGAKINAPEGSCNVDVIELPSNERRKIPKKFLGGTRHQSAARLVEVNPGAIVLTISQDGPISLFEWDQESGVVLIQKYLERFLAGYHQADR